MQEFLNLHGFLTQGEKNKYWEIDQEKKKITYFLKNNKSYKITDPEELVRAEFLMELIEKYQYDSQDIEFEREMPQRVPNFYADIVVNHPKTDIPFLVLECKRVDITDAEFEQAVKQGAGNARVLGGEYFGTVAGESRRFFLTKNFSEKNPLEKAESDCPVKYNKPEEWRFKKGDPLWELGTIDQDGLKSILEKCHQTIWQGGKRNPGEAFSEVAKVIFVKVFDEKTLTKPGQFYQFQRKSGESTANVKKRIDEIYNEAKKRDPEVFSEDIRLDAQEITTVVEHLQKISLNKTDLDVKGEAFQKFMGNFFKGDFGQYFTPPPTVQFCLDLFKDEMDDSHMVIDPACGSGGFLLKALDTLRKQADEIFPDKKSIEHFRYWHDFAEYKLFGCEISESIARVAKMNMILHDDGHTNVIANDSLEPLDILEMKNKGFTAENFDYIFTNPPFGATIRGSEKPYLSDYELAFKKKNQKTEILFLERCWQFLKAPTKDEKGGKMVVVLPDGILTNSSLQYVRDWILDHFKLLGVVSLPQDAFRYYGAGVKSSILILEKGKFTEDYPIFMAQPEKIGIDSTGRPCPNDLDEVVKNFWEFYKDPKGFQKKKPENIDWIFIVEKKDLKARFDFDFFCSQSLLSDVQNLVPLSSIFDVKGGKRIPKGQHYSTTETNYKYLTVTNIDKDGGFDYEKLKFLTEETYQVIKRYELEEKSLVISIAGTIGKISFFEKKFPKKIILTENCAKLVLKENYREVSFSYINHVLESEFLQNQMSQSYIKTTIPKLGLERIKNLQIPLPDIKIQKQIAEKMDIAFAIKKEKEHEAKEILASIEPYLLGELGIEKVEEEEKEMVFCISRKDLKDDLSPESFQETGKNKFRKSIYPLETAKKILKIDWGNTNLTKNIYKDEGAYSAYSAAGNDGKIDFYENNSNGIILSAIGARCGKCFFAQGKWTAIKNTIVILPKNDLFDFQYIFEILNDENIWKKSGGAQPFITLKTANALKIPLPPLSIQQKISAEISARRENAKQLKKEAGEILEMAKREVEGIILE